MGHIIKDVCVFGVLSAVALTMAPDKGTKNIMNIMCSLIVLLILIQPLSGFDFGTYASSIAEFNEISEELIANGEDMNSRLNRVVIEKEYETYIMDKASKLDITLDGVSVELRWDTKGYWVPSKVIYKSVNRTENVRKLIDIVEAEFGIAESEQHWEYIE